MANLVSTVDYICVVTGHEDRLLNDDNEPDLSLSGFPDIFRPTKFADSLYDIISVGDVILNEKEYKNIENCINKRGIVFRRYEKSPLEMTEAFFPIEYCEEYGYERIKIMEENKMRVMILEYDTYQEDTD